MLRSPLEDLRVEGELIHGFHRGVVEDNDDPQKAGRVRVRIFGIYSPDSIFLILATLSKFCSFLLK